jgi:hypothetical protein
MRMQGSKSLFQAVLNTSFVVLVTLSGIFGTSLRSKETHEEAGSVSMGLYHARAELRLISVIFFQGNDAYFLGPDVA